MADHRADPYDIGPDLSKIRYIAMDGTPLRLDEWGAQFGDFDARLIGHDTVNGVDIITVLTGHREPEIGVYPFGAALKSPAGSICEIAQYDTAEQAKAGHADIMAWLVTHPRGEFTDEVRREIIPNSHPAS